MTNATAETTAVKGFDLFTEMAQVDLSHVWPEQERIATGGTMLGKLDENGKRLEWLRTKFWYESRDLGVKIDDLREKHLEEHRQASNVEHNCKKYRETIERLQAERQLTAERAKYITHALVSHIALQYPGCNDSALEIREDDTIYEADRPLGPQRHSFGVFEPSGFPEETDILDLLLFASLVDGRRRP